MAREDGTVSITLGVEEELFLVDPDSRDLVRDPDPAVIADRQVDHYRLRRLEGDTDEEALRSVVDLVIAETRQGI